MDDSRRERLLKEATMCEKALDANVDKGELAYNDAWYAYYLVMDQYARAGAVRDARRIRDEKIDTELFHPLESEHPEVVATAQQRAAEHNGDPFGI